MLLMYRDMCEMTEVLADFLSYRKNYPISDIMFKKLRVLSLLSSSEGSWHDNDSCVPISYALRSVSVGKVYPK